MYPCTIILAAFLWRFSVDAGAVPAARNAWPDPYGLHPNQVYPFARLFSPPALGNSTAPPRPPPSNSSAHPPTRLRSWPSTGTRSLRARQAGDAEQVEQAPPSPAVPQDTRPTPAPTGDPSPSTTVHINSVDDFALLLPSRAGELVSDAEADGVAFCSPSSGEAQCTNRMPEGFITAAALTRADDDSWVQITGCLDPTRSTLDPSDAGGQFDVRFPNGAQCTFGGYAASFIELVEPALNRFCIRCCAAENDQVNCNSHMDRQGCENAVPGVYDFPDRGVSCS
ncbi:hypothetical protein FA95DRAFT_1500726 [Auriscalpium vulgare]|uniref:Uncharacterized protein n=1 Tax=Auriscalpium vulgare TaxID=40419 RepID=A0ACB8RE84_9AGAM|nr:hypothetical protein FA95DRAFT_1500726 [Auriscalpium vulgare]